MSIAWDSEKEYLYPPIENITSEATTRITVLRQEKGPPELRRGHKSGER